MVVQEEENKENEKKKKSGKKGMKKKGFLVAPVKDVLIATPTDGVSYAAMLKKKEVEGEGKEE